MWWRAAKNLEAALDAGMDPLQVVIDRAHEKDIQVIASLRINDPGTVNGPNRQPYMCNLHENRRRPHPAPFYPALPEGRRPALTELDFAA